MKPPATSPTRPTEGRTRSIIAQLRDIVPLRALSREEALSIAERQALRLLQLQGTIAAPVHERMIAELPRIHVERMSPWPSSGATHWVSGRWVVVLNGAEPLVRQRFSLAHELKHIIDHPFVDVLYDGIPQADRHEFIERICDYFAGCLLIPRPWLKKAWATESQHLPTLARTFHVSLAAITTRLHQTGIIAPQPRCSRPPRDWAIKAIRKAGGNALYHRELAPHAPA